MSSDIMSSAGPDLQQRVRQVARRARGLVRLYGLSWFVAVVCLVALGLGLIDYLVRFQDLGVRLICFALVCLAVAWGGFRYLYSAWRYRCSDLQAAQRIEGQFPALGGLLSSAVAFCTQSASDETAGSFELRRTVVAQAESAAEPLDFAVCLDRRQSLRALYVAGAVIGTILVLMLLDGPAFGLAARRLLAPWGEYPWPRRHVLEFVGAPTRLAAGEDFEVELVDANGSLPDQVQIHYWFDGEDAAGVQTQVMQPLGQKLTHRLTNVTRGFYYRATGGDDQRMPWTELQIVEPARVVVQEIHLDPPRYTGLASRAAAGNFRTLRGTRVTLHVRVSKPLSSAALETDTTDGERSIALRLDADRTGCSLGSDDAETWEIRKSGSYGFRLVDRDGTDSGAKDRWEVEAIQDAPPTVSLKRPTADLFVTAQAKLIVESVVKDDLAIRTVALHFTRSDAAEQGEQVVALWNGPERATAESGSVEGREYEGVQRTERYAWDLSSLPQLEPGASLAFRVVATDYLPQDGPSVTRQITIISVEDYEERIAQRQAEILAQVAEVARVQQQTHGQTAQLEIPLREIGALGREEVDQLQGAELNQRQVQQRLGHPHDGVGAQVAELIEELEGNPLNSSGTVERLQELRDGVRALNENTLPQIEHRVIDALKLAREGLARRGKDGTGGDPAMRDPLLKLVREAAADQQEVVRSLEQMLGQLSQWDSYRQLAREVGQLRREQERVNERTQDLRRQTLSKDVQGLTDAQRVALLRLTEQQNDIALRFDTLRGRMDVTRQGLAQDNPSAAATLVEAIEMVQRVGIGGGMRDAARGMQNNRLSQASEKQAWVIQRLGELQDILANRRDQPLDRMVDRWQELADELRGLQSRQDVLTNQIEQAAELSPAQLAAAASEESQLSNQARQLSPRMRRAEARRAEAAISRAAGELKMAADSADQRDKPALQQHAAEAKKQLDAAQQHVQESLHDAQQALRQKRVSQLLQAVGELRDRQQRLWTETQQLDPQRPAATDATAAQADGALPRVAQEQATLGRDVVGLQQTVADIESLSLALGDAGAAAAAAAGRIQQPDDEAVPQTLTHQQQVIDILTRVLAALQDDPPGPQDPQAPQEDPPTAPSPPEGNPNEPFSLMQLKLIRGMQQELNDRTARLDQVARDTHGWNADRVREQLELATRQGALAGLLGQLLNADAPDDPAATSPPSVRPLEGLEPVLDPDAKPTPDQPRTGENTLDQELLDGLPGALLPSSSLQPAASSLPPAASSPQPPLQRIRQRMREVEQRLAQRDLAEPTQAEQRQIVAELQTLIADLASQQQQQQSQRRARSGERQGQDTTDKQGQEAAADSTDRTAQGSSAGDGSETVQRVVGEIWGHLPERYRRQMQNAGAVEFLPQYRTLIEDYYRRLSEDRDQRP